jgi:hypothetical protein
MNEVKSSLSQLGNPLHKSFIKILISTLLILIFILIYANIIWYLSVLIVSLISLSFFPRAYGRIIRRQFNFIQLDISTSKFSSTILVLFLTLLFWWIFWIFWIDISLNQLKWIYVDIPLIPIDYFKISKIDPGNILFLTLHPSKVISYLSVYYENGYFSVFGIKPSGLLLLILWLVELRIMYHFMYEEIFKK